MQLDALKNDTHLGAYTKCRQFSQCTQENPADFSYRPTPPDVLIQSYWFTGSSFLWNVDYRPVPYDISFTQDILPG